MSAPELPTTFLPPEVLPDGMELLPVWLSVPDTKSVAGTLRVIRNGHASVLIQWNDETLLTDPWFSQTTSFSGYYSGESLAHSIETLPKLTGVLGSMNHWDHFDMPHFAAYRDKSVPVIVPFGTTQDDQAKEAGFTDVRALHPWDSVTLGSFKITAVSSKPEQPTNAFEYEHAYFIEVAGRSVLFCSHFMEPGVQEEVARRFGEVDVAIVGINHLSLKYAHYHQLSMGAEDVAALCKRLGVKVVIPVHYTFHGDWASNAFIISHRGTPEAMADAVRVTSPATVALPIKPGKQFNMTWGYDTKLDDADADRLQKAMLAFFKKLDTGDMSAFDLFSPTFIHHNPLPRAEDNSADGARRGFAALRQRVTDMRLEPQSFLVEGSCVATRLLNTGFIGNPAARGERQPLHSLIHMLYRFKDGQVNEEWIEGDINELLSVGGEEKK